MNDENLDKLIKKALRKLDGVSDRRKELLMKKRSVQEELEFRELSGEAKALLEVVRWLVYKEVA